MLLSKITINNFRLIVNAELDVHRNITLIVGRNNTAKTSCMSILEKVVKNKVLSYNDYPLQRRKYAFILLAQFMRKKITYEQLCKRLPLTSIEFLIDYSLDDAEDNLGALSPFIIDVDVDTTTAWNAIKQYQSTLIKIISEDESLWSTEGDFFAIRKVEYTLGHRYNENGIMYLYHDDVIRLFAALLDNAKFRRVFSDKYPLILIDEYQDSLKPIIDRFLEYFISLNSGPQFGFFGDSWQTIYQSNKACGLIQHENIVEIKKGANFRSAPKIVDLLNFIRPELPQRSAIDNFAGEVTVITCDDYIGERRTDRNFKGDLPSPELKERLNGLMKHIKHSCIPASENVKTLMITHRVLAAQQGYNKLLDILKDGLRDKEDPFLLFFMEQLEPIYQALETNDMQLLFDTLKLKRYPITKKAEKVKWKNLQEALKIARQKNSVDVLQTVFEAKLIPIPAKIDGYYDLYLNAPETMYSGADVTIKDFLDIEYEQFLAAINYFHPEADFSTEHGVKGEEYDNVIFVISKGWNQYQFETYTPMIKNGYPQDKEAAYIRNRNLFYVCCSRPKKRLYFFVSVPVDRVFRKFLAEMVGEDNILTYSEFLNSQNHSKTE